MDDLAVATGIPRATLYYYFSGKNDVLSFLLTQKVLRGTAVVAEAAAGSGTPTERLAAVLRAMLHAMAESPVLCTRLLGWMVTERGGDVFVETERALMAPVRELLIEGRAAGEFSDLDPFDAATALMGAVSMVAMRHATSGSFDPDAIADRLVPSLLDGLRTRAEPEPSAAPPRRRRPSG